MNAGLFTGWTTRAGRASTVRSVANYHLTGALTGTQASGTLAISETVTGKVMVVATAAGTSGNSAISVTARVASQTSVAWEASGFASGANYSIDIQVIEFY